MAVDFLGELFTWALEVFDREECLEAFERAYGVENLVELYTDRNYDQRDYDRINISAKVDSVWSVLEYIKKRYGEESS